MAKQLTKELKPLSCKLGLHSFVTWDNVYAHSPGDDKEFALRMRYCRFCSKRKYSEV